METGLAHQMVYGSGSGQNTKHFYAGAAPKKKTTCTRKKKRRSNK